MRLLTETLIGLVLLAPPANALQLGPPTLNHFSRVPSNIRTAAVFDQDGVLWGAVRDVATNEAGRPSAISIIPAGTNVLYVVGAAGVRYDKLRNVVTAKDGAWPSGKVLGGPGA